MNISLRKIERLFEQAFKADSSLTRVVDADRVLDFARQHKTNSVSAAYVLGRLDAMIYMQEAMNGIESSSKVRLAVDAMRDLTGDEFMRVLGKVSGDRLGFN